MATKRRTREQWQALIDEQAESELSVSEFCAQYDLTVSNFYLWRKKLSNDSQSLTKPDNWLAFDIPASAEKEPGGAWEIELALPGGVVLRMNRAA
jgi:putative transposase